MKPAAYNVFARACPSRSAFEAIFSRWGILVLGCLSEQPSRFGAIRDHIDGISEKMLAQTLKTLEEEGLVIRQDWNEKPPRVEYSLSPAGQTLAAGVATVIADLYTMLEERAKLPSSSPS